MIDMVLAQAKKSFLNEEKIMAAKNKAMIRALGQFGAFVRRTAKTSTRKSKATSKPGEPFNSKLGLVRDNIFFVVDTANEDVVIGPIKLNKPTPLVLKALEYGGPTLIMGRGRDKGKLIPTTIAQRSFMRPAFAAESTNPKLSKLLKDKIK